MGAETGAQFIPLANQISQLSATALMFLANCFTVWLWKQERDERRELQKQQLGLAVDSLNTVNSLKSAVEAIQATLKKE